MEEKKKKIMEERMKREEELKQQQEEEGKKTEISRKVKASELKALKLRKNEQFVTLIINTKIHRNVIFKALLMQEKQQLRRKKKT